MKKIKLRSFDIGSVIVCEGEIALLKMERKLNSLGYETEPVHSEGVYGLRIVAKKQVQK